MARKTLLTESEIRQFMKLANIKPLQEMGGSYGMPPGMRDDEDEDPPGMRDMREGEDEDEDPPGMRDMREEEGEEEPPAEMDAPAPEAGDDMEMDMDMGGDDMGADMDMGAEGGAKEEQFADIVDKLADLLGLDADVEVGEGEMEMGGEAMDDEGGDLEGAMDAPVGDDDDMGVEVEDDELMGEEEIVQEVARRVAARLIREKKQDAMANKLAERIFRRLASK